MKVGDVLVSNQIIEFTGIKLYGHRWEVVTSKFIKGKYIIALMCSIEGKRYGMYVEEDTFDEAKASIEEQFDYADMSWEVE